MKRILFVLTLFCSLALISSASASSYKFVIENGGGSYSLASGDYLGLLGIRVSDVAQTDIQDVANQITSGTFSNVYAGPDYGSAPEWTPLNLADLVDFDASGNARQSLWFEFGPSNLVFSHKGYGGTATMGTNGNLGCLDEVPPAVPIPGIAWLLGSGFLGIVGLRKKMHA